jgi:TetR/AcrR family transcriptional regulator
VRPDTAARLDKALAMLLFGMINWMYTWLKPDGTLTHASMAPVVADLFFGGIDAVTVPRRRAPASAPTPSTHTDKETLA